MTFKTVANDKLGPAPPTTLTAEDHANNHLPDVLARWFQRDGTETARPRTAQSFCVPNAEITAQGYELSPGTYKELVHQGLEHRSPRDILNELGQLETEIHRGLDELKEVLK